MSVQVIRVGERGSPRVVSVTAPATAGPVVTSARRPWGESSDVDTAGAPDDTPLVLRRHVADGVFRLEPAPPGAEPVDWFVGQGPPGVIVGAGPGDMYVDELTGQLYQLR